MQGGWHGVTYDSVLVDLVPLARGIERPCPAAARARHLGVLGELEVDLGGVARHLVLAQNLVEWLWVARLWRHDEHVDAAHVDDLIGFGRERLVLLDGFEVGHQCQSEAQVQRISGRVSRREVRRQIKPVRRFSGRNVPECHDMFSDAFAGESLRLQGSILKCEESRH